MTITYQTTTRILLLLAVAFSLESFLFLCDGLVAPHPTTIKSSTLEIGPKIGNGTFGTVRWAWLNHCDGDNNENVELVVAKMAHTDVTNSKTYLDTEAYLNRRLCRNSHPNLPPYLGECTKDDTKHLIWRASGNNTLESFLDLPDENNDKTNTLLAKALDIEYLATPHCLHSLAREVLLQILSALSYCHAKGVVHRDLKPANILVDDYSHSLRLIDFGSAADMASMVDRRGYRGTNQGVRSILFCAPEEFVEEDHPYAFDVYSAAVCWLRVMVPGLRTSEDDLFRFRMAVRDCGHDLEAWHEVAHKENCLPYGWECLFDSTDEGNDAFRLLVDMMKYEPSHRPSASEALLQPYLNPGCMEPTRPFPPARPWSLSSHMERWVSQFEEKECQIPDWFFDETVSIELHLPIGLVFIDAGPNNQGVIVAELEKGSEAEKLGSLQPGDSLLAIGQSIVKDANLPDVLRILNQWPHKTVSLEFVRR